MLTRVTLEQNLRIVRLIEHTDPAATPRDEVTDVTTHYRTGGARYAPSVACAGWSGLASALRAAPSTGADAGLRSWGVGVDAVIRTPIRARPIAGN